MAKACVLRASLLRVGGAGGARLLFSALSLSHDSPLNEPCCALDPPRAAAAQNPPRLATKQSAGWKSASPGVPLRVRAP